MKSFVGQCNNPGLSLATTALLITELMYVSLSHMAHFRAGILTLQGSIYTKLDYKYATHEI